MFDFQNFFIQTLHNIFHNMAAFLLKLMICWTFDIFGRRQNWFSQPDILAQTFYKVDEAKWLTIEFTDRTENAIVTKQL